MFEDLNFNLFEGFKIKFVVCPLSMMVEIISCHTSSALLQQKSLHKASQHCLSFSKAGLGRLKYFRGIWHQPPSIQSTMTNVNTGVRRIYLLSHVPSVIYKLNMLL